MVTQTIKTVIQFRRDTTANWELYKATVPASGEPCYDINLKTLRIGDGVTAYENLPTIGGADSPEELQAAIEQLQTQIGNANVVEIHENYTNLTTQVNAVNTEVASMQQTLETKADAETVTELQTVVEQKLDAEAVETLETELKTYIDEALKNVETGDMDGGVIE